mmetsp:Transcript_8737/g.22900  ORF Transcript_8737/g.22900 Transcript_8737/m.22900 type:complete len:358 (+) Transcript_8737:67-1140(+)
MHVGLPSNARADSSADAAVERSGSPRGTKREAEPAEGGADFAQAQNGIRVKLEPDLSVAGTQSAAFFGSRAFGADEAEKTARILSQPVGLGEFAVRQGPGGRMIPYIEGWRAIEHAHKVFGFNGWSSRIVSTTLEFCDSSNGRHSACASAIVEITLKDGTVHQDIGTGSIENARTKFEAIEKVKKEAVTDARKRALKNFGAFLGNSLYDRSTMQRLESESRRRILAEQVDRRRARTAATATAQPGQVASRPAPGPTPSNALAAEPIAASSAAGQQHGATLFADRRAREVEHVGNDHQPVNAAYIGMQCANATESIDYSGTDLQPTIIRGAENLRQQLASEREEIEVTSRLWAEEADI